VYSQLCCVFSSDFPGELENYTIRDLTSIIKVTNWYRTAKFLNFSSAAVKTPSNKHVNCCTYNDKRNEVDPVPEWMRVLHVVHNVDPTLQAYHLHSTKHRTATWRTKKRSIFIHQLSCRMVSVLDSGAEGPVFKSQSRRCRLTVLGKLFTPIMSQFTNKRNW